MGYTDERAKHRTTPIRNAGFVSYFSSSSVSDRRSADAYDVRLRRQKWMKVLAIVCLTSICTWFVLESAQALSTF